ncbi:peptidoglycan DD-metalloendopeptidase family protein [Helicobacter sp. CaF467b]|uniref:murein hydrolase activator EnvC family protein n=1 Tax=Helicobacter sp. CaF467b TaxID=2919923 RepID=UPI001F568964|nr:peptidoglycan DD-metalloendopeptidase family protein [Helicobacter sp. CaF467b]MCI2236073.1 peptidoglycan DD-metalloendopeptidase family protein [Helicobacter sp. CaF467b]
MLRLFFVFLCLIQLQANQEINQKISKNKTALENQKKKEAQVNQKLQELGKEVNKQKEELSTIENIIKESEKNISKNKQEYSKKETLIKTLSSNQESLYQKRKDIELAIIDLVAKDISFAILLNDFQPESIRDLITEESFKVLNNTTKKELANLSQQQTQIIQDLKTLQKEIAQLQSFIDSENKKRANLKDLQAKQKKALNAYQKEIDKYNQELQQITKERDSLQEILVQLNILKSQEEEKRKKREELAKTKNTTTPKSTQSDFDVRQVASSYHNISTTKYKGAKTIAPLDNFKIDKRFGPYYDPVYKMKVFNESITLISTGDDKVKSVLDGKVIFAKDTPILKKVIIIEHQNNMHTIYAQLDKIAPTIKPGSIVKKGYTIGRINNALKFEVTLKDKHIDPLELISEKNL